MLTDSAWFTRPRPPSTQSGAVAAANLFVRLKLEIKCRHHHHLATRAQSTYLIPLHCTRDQYFTEAAFCAIFNLGPRLVICNNAATGCCTSDHCTIFCPSLVISFSIMTAWVRYPLSILSISTLPKTANPVNCHAAVHCRCCSSGSAVTSRYERKLIKSGLERDKIISSSRYLVVHDILFGHVTTQ